MQTTRFFSKLAALLVLDVVLTFGYSYIPTTWIPARDAGNAVILAVMAATMLVTIRRVLQDY